jgi:hypothetical protein
VCRPGAALDAFLLKIVVEERLGYPAELLSDGQLADIRPGLKLNIAEGTSNANGIYSALARGEVDMYPEVTPADIMPYGHGGMCNTSPKSVLDSDSQVWPSLDSEEYDVYVRREGKVPFFARLFVPSFRVPSHYLDRPHP